MNDRPIEDRDIRDYREPDPTVDDIPVQPQVHTGAMPAPGADVDTGIMSPPAGAPQTDVMDPREPASPFIAPVSSDRVYRPDSTGDEETHR